MSVHLWFSLSWEGYLLHQFLTAVLTLVVCLTWVNKSVQQGEKAEIQHSTAHIQEFTASPISLLLALTSLYYNTLGVCMELILSIPNSSISCSFCRLLSGRAEIHLALHLHEASGLRHSWSPLSATQRFPLASLLCCKSDYSSFIWNGDWAHKMLSLFIDLPHFCLRG